LADHGELVACLEQFADATAHTGMVIDDHDPYDRVRRVVGD
jgi:hypothetical protein